MHLLNEYHFSYDGPILITQAALYDVMTNAICSHHYGPDLYRRNQPLHKHQEEDSVTSPTHTLLLERALGIWYDLS